MKHNIIAAIIIAVGLIVAGFLHGGRYYMLRLDNRSVARMDRWTGAVAVCELPDSGAASCEITKPWWFGLEDADKDWLEGKNSN